MSKYVCAECNSDDVESKYWVKINTNEINGIVDEPDNSGNWCCNCEQHVVLQEVEGIPLLLAKN